MFKPTELKGRFKKFLNADQDLDAFIHVNEAGTALMISDCSRTITLDFLAGVVDGDFEVEDYEMADRYIKRLEDEKKIFDNLENKLKIIRDALNFLEDKLKIRRADDFDALCHLKRITGNE